MRFPGIEGGAGGKLKARRRAPVPVNIVILHDAHALPVDYYHALTDAGHVVASHGAHAPALPGFLDALKWTPHAFIVDFRGDAAPALNVVRWLAGSPWRGKPLLLPHVPEDARAIAQDAVKDARFVDAPADAVHALSGA
jgi:hypothetical protein